MKNRKTFLMLLFLFTVGVFMLSSFKKRESRKRPNIIFLLADDLRYNSLGCMGNSIIKTPSIDQLAHTGTLFLNSYVTTSICCISRASIFSGQYASRHGIADFVTPFSDSARMNAYPEILRREGYYTGFIGKYGVGSKLPKEDFDYWRGFGGMGTYKHKDAQGNFKHLSSLIGDQAEEFLDGVKKDKPFCLSISFKAPHVEGTNIFLPSAAYDSLYVNDHIPLPVTGNDEYYEAFPDVFKYHNEENEARLRWQVRFSTPELYQENVKKYFRLINGIDDVVKRIRIKLAASGMDKNTIIIFTSDNGFYLGEHGLAGKWYGNEESVRVPLIVYDPRAAQEQKGTVRKEMTLNVDMAPTILDYAGVKVPGEMQGKSFRQLVEGKNLEWRNEFYYNHLFQSPQVNIPKSEGLVRKEYKYMRYYNDKDPDNFFYEELFNTVIDPYEVNNLANKSENANLKKEMISKMKHYRSELK